MKKPSTKKRNEVNSMYHLTAKEANGLISGNLNPREQAIAQQKITRISEKISQYTIESENKIFESEFEKGLSKKQFYHPYTGHKIYEFDVTTLDIVIRTTAKMTFPDKKYRSIREKIQKIRPRSLENIYSEKTLYDFSKQYRRAQIVGCVFKIQCEHYMIGKRTRSLNVIMHANDKGFFKEWSELGLKVGTARKYMTDFKHVLHLLAADQALTGTDKQTYPNAPKDFFAIPFISFYISPPRFFLAAEHFRQLALDAGLCNNKKNLWMPEGWKELIKDAPPLEYGGADNASQEEIKLFDQFEEEYKKLRLWEHGYPRPK